MPDRGSAFYNMPEIMQINEKVYRTFLADLYAS